MPAQFEEEGGKPVAVTLDFGPAMDSRSVVTAWDPPRLFAREELAGPRFPPIATEFSVEARAGGICVVRVVRSLFSSTDDWDAQLTGAEEGGRASPASCALSHALPRTALGDHADHVPGAGHGRRGVETLTAALGLHGARGGSLRRTGGCACAWRRGGYISDSPCGALMRLDTPGPGTAAFGTIKFGSMVMATLTFYMYGEQAAENVTRHTPLWQAWMQERFPMPAVMDDATP
ncbi:MAG: SRPBCC domain-containing protein [Gemmatimonadetes bacterium]|nr:SRPBCC domain-containing protein [Gemmatimonadota bacterium]